MLYLILLDLINRIIFGEEKRSLSSSFCSFHHSHVISSLLGPHILLNTLFSNTLSLCSSLNVSNQVSHPLLHKNLIHLVVCLTTGPKPLPKRALHIVHKNTDKILKHCQTAYVKPLDITALPFFLLALQPPVGHGPLIHEFSRSHTTTHHSR